MIFSLKIKTLAIIIAATLFFSANAMLAEASIAAGSTCAGPTECAANCAGGTYKKMEATYTSGDFGIVELSPEYYLCTGAAATKFQYTLLEAFPGFFSAGASPDLPAMILAIYKFGIWTVGIAGLFMLVIGGFTYMASAGNNAALTNAKKIIWDSLLGIVAAMGAYLVMYVINPDLTKINISFTTADITESAETSAESAGTLQAGTEGSCGGLATQKGISSQCSAASSQLSGLLTCVAGKLPSAIINSISDSKGYSSCVPGSWSKPPCAHSKYSCHYGGKNCSASGNSYAVDFSTRNLSASQVSAAANACGASHVIDESSSANHIHVSVGKAAGCGCN